MIFTAGLKPGQWVCFSGEGISKELQGPFKVIKRDDFYGDEGRCELMDLDGKLFDYCPRMQTLGWGLKHQQLPWNYSRKVVDESFVKEMSEKKENIQKKAIELLKSLKS